MLFELGEILEGDLAEGMAFSTTQSGKKAAAISVGDVELANSIQTAGFRTYPANAALERMLRRKLRYNYITEGLPTNLLLFYDTQRPWGPFDYLLSWEDELARLIETSVFQTVWIFCLPAMAVIGRLDVRNGALYALFDWSFHFDASAPFEALAPGDDGSPDEVRRFTPVLTPRRTKPS